MAVLLTIAATVQTQPPFSLDLFSLCVQIGDIKFTPIDKSASLQTAMTGAGSLCACLLRNYDTAADFRSNNLHLWRLWRRAIAQVVSRRLPSAAVRIWSQVMQDLWWTKCNWGRFSPSTSVSPSNSHFTDCSTFIYHPGLVQGALWWPAYQVNSISLQPANKKN
jgi:hypothetical protein